MGIDELLAKVNKRLEELAAAEKKGENVGDEKAELEEKKAELEKLLKGSAAGGGTDDGKGAEAKPEEKDELAELRAFKARTELEKAVDTAAATIVDGHKRQQAELTAGLATVLEKAVEEKLGGGGAESGLIGGLVDDAVANALKTVRRPSRYAGAGSSDDVLDALAAGGSIADVPDRYAGLDFGEADLRSARPNGSGGHKAVKAMLESKNLLVLMGAMYRQQKGFASEGDHLFLRALGQKAMAEGTPSAGGYLVPQEWMSDILGLLRAQAVVRRGGPRIIPFARQMNQTSISSGSTAYYTAENAPITLSELTFAEAPILTPKNLTGMVAVSNYLLEDAPGADDVVRSDMTEVLGLREDLAFLQGTGGTEPTGMRNMVGVTLNPIAPGGAGFQPTLIDWRKIKARIRRLTSPGAKWVAFMAPELVTRFETLTDTTGRFLADANLLEYDDSTGEGKLDTIPFYTSQQIPTNLTLGASTDVSYVILVNMADLLVGENQVLTIDFSAHAAYQIGGVWHSAFQETQTLFRAVLRHDLAHRRPQQVIVQEGVRTTA